MKQRFIAWLHNTRLRDPIERGQAGALQIILLVLALGGAVICFILVPLPANNSLGAVVSYLGSRLLLIGPVTALFILRRGRFIAAVVLIALSFILSNTMSVVSIGVSNARPLLFIYLLPLTLVGLLAPRRYLLFASGMIIAAIAVATVLEANHSPLTGFIPPPPTMSPDGTPLFISNIVAMTIFFTLFGSSLRQALHRAQAREHELEHLRASLEATVLTRTGELRTALTEVETRAAEQASLLQENTLQRDTIREMSVPILPLDADTLVIPLIGALDSARLQNLQEHALRAIELRGARRILLDVTGVLVIDTQVAHGIVTIAQATQLMGAETVLVGVRPEVAQTIVGLGLQLSDVQSVRDLQAALALAKHQPASHSKRMAQPTLITR